MHAFKGFRGFKPFIATALTATLCSAVLLLTTPAIAQTVSTVAGTGIASSTNDGLAATTATLNLPLGVLVRRDGSVLIAEERGHRVRKIDAAGIITTFAGTGTRGFTATAALATNANLDRPGGLAEDAAGNVYIGSLGAIQKVSPSGALTTVAGNSTPGNLGDGGSASDTSVRVSWPLSLAFDAAGNLFFADYNANVIRKIDGTTNFITTVATGLLNPLGLLVQSDGSLLVADGSNNRVLKIIPGGATSTIAGTSGGFSSTGENVPATAATFQTPYGLAQDAAGNIYVGDFSANRIRKIAPNGIITTLLGTPAGAVDSISPLASVDGALSIATVRSPIALALDAAGNLYVASYLGHRVRKITLMPPVIVPGPSVFKSFANTVTADLGSISPAGEQTVPFGGIVQVTVTAKPRHVLRVASNCDYVKTSAPIALVPNGTGVETYAVTVNGPCSMEATFTPLIPKANVNSEIAANALFTGVERSQVYAAPNPIVQTSSVVGAAVKLKAWVTDIAGVPYASATNVITFKANGVAISGCVNVPLTLRASNVVHIREASCTKSFATAGNVTITSEFAGDTYNFPAVSSALNHSVVAPQ